MGTHRKNTVKSCSEDSSFSPLVRLLMRQGYRFADHAAVKVCAYLRNSLRGMYACYKQKFYGIQSHRCLQCTPSVFSCTHACRFCWRVIPEEEHLASPSLSWKQPSSLVDTLIFHHRELISGFGGYRHVEKRKFSEALLPRHAAISLSGEPTLYPFLGEFIREFHQRGMTTFLVTNGTQPHALELLAENNALPTQLYLSLVAYDEPSYYSVTRSRLADGWHRFLRSVDLMAHFSKKTRTVLRMTLAHGVNMTNPNDYALLIRRASPHYVEVKAFMYVGGARHPARNLSLAAMPTHEEIKTFGEKLARSVGYQLIDEHVPSRVVLLTKDEETATQRFIDGRSSLVVERT